MTMRIITKVLNSKFAQFYYKYFENSIIGKKINQMITHIETMLTFRKSFRPLVAQLHAIIYIEELYLLTFNSFENLQLTILLLKKHMPLDLLY